MENTHINSSSKFVASQSDFQKLILILKKENYTIIAPKVKDNAIIYDEIVSAEDLPIGIKDKQEKGKYFIEKTSSGKYFDFVVGPNSLKNYFFPTEKIIFKAVKNKNGFDILEENYETKKYAFIGVRSCDLEGLKTQDKVFLNGQYKDSYYKKIRDEALIISVNCTTKADTCFCVSMNSGPACKTGFDLSLTEIKLNPSHYFIIEVGSVMGEKIISKLKLLLATEKEISAGENLIEQNKNNFIRNIETKNLKEKLFKNFESPIWDEIATRCLSCANCTMVCPTCFCSTVEDITDLKGENAKRISKWDSCFTIEHSYIHGGNIRSSVKSRYRQWLLHKFSYWVDQFDTFGCVGCGRCITWCPVGIDVTEEIKKITK